MLILDSRMTEVLTGERDSWMVRRRRQIPLSEFDYPCKYVEILCLHLRKDVLHVTKIESPVPFVGRLILLWLLTKETMTALTVCLR